MNKQIILIGLLAVVAVVLLKQQQRPTYYPPVTGNAVRDNKVNDILAYIAAGTASATAIMEIINKIKNMSDSQVNNYYDKVSNGADPWAATA